MTTNSRDSISSLQLQLPSTHESLTAMMDQLEGFAKREAFDEDLTYRLLLVTSEAVTNAIRHGNELDPTKTVTLTVDVYDAHVDVRVQDEGVGFERDALSDPRLDNNLLREGGRGVFLIEELADSVSYEERGRTVRMRLSRT